MSTEENKPSRTSLKAEEKEQTEKKKKKRGRKRERVRLIPIWLRLVIVVLLFALSGITGAMVGYGVIGNGTPMDVFEKETWQHIFDILSGVEK